MKTIGILGGEDREFTNDLITLINQDESGSISAEMLQIGAIFNSDIKKYSVLLDRVADYVPFFGSYIRLALLGGVPVINSKLYFIPDDALYFNSIASNLKLNVPRTTALPSKQHPAGTNSEFMYNLEFPIDWNLVFDRIQFPAILKPNKVSPYYNSHIVYNPNEFFSIYDLTGSDIMILQEYINYDEYYRVYTVGKENKIMGYNPNAPLLSRFSQTNNVIDKSIEKAILSSVKKFNSKLGIDFNAIEVAVKDGVPFLTEIINIDPFTSSAILKTENYNWLLNTMANYLISFTEDKAKGKK